MDQKSGLDLSKEKNRSVCSPSIIWGNNHHLHLRLTNVFFLNQNNKTNHKKSPNMHTTEGIV